MDRVTGPHDLGGLRTSGLTDLDTIDTSDKKWKYWERQCNAVVWLLVQKGLMTLDELRRATEALPGYATMDYYTKWAAASAAIAIERGILTQQQWELQLGSDPSTLDNTARFQQGDVVQIKPENSSIRWRRPHLRTPGYIFGLIGRIERPCVGVFGDPERKAFREDGPDQPLYRVRFKQTHVWELYQGGADDTIDIEIFQPWLQQASEQQLQEQEQRSHALRQQMQVHSDQEVHHEHGALPGHHHKHADAEGQDHVHEERAKVEQDAVELEGDESSRLRIAEALRDLLVQQGIITMQELQREVELMDARGMKQDGPRLVARAWTDPSFKARLLQDMTAAASELGISTSNFSPAAAAASHHSASPPQRSGTVLTAVENTESVHNLVVCTLCSCYPISVLGMSPHWYRSRWVVVWEEECERGRWGLPAEHGGCKGK